MKNWSPEYFAERFGDAEIEVQQKRESDPQYERNSGKHKGRIRMKEFVRMVRETGKSNDFYLTANNTKGSKAGLTALFQEIEEFGPGYNQRDQDRSGMFLEEERGRSRMALPIVVIEVTTGEEERGRSSYSSADCLRGLPRGRIVHSRPSLFAVRTCH